MKGFTALLLGIFGTLAFSWLGLAFVPNLQIGHLDPQTEEDGSDAYPLPKSGMAERGRRVYIGNGCFYCHSQQVRADYASADIERKWGTRRSAPRDYIFDRPVLLGKMRIGPDLSNVGKRAPVQEENAPPNASPAAGAAATPANASPAQAAASPAPASSAAPAASSPGPAQGQSAAPVQQAAASPGPSPQANATGATANNSPNPAPAASPPPMQQAANAVAGQASSMEGAPAGKLPEYSAAWHHAHLYSPRSVNIDSTMPSYKFLYEKRRVGGQPAANALKLKGDEATGEGWEIVPSYDAECLVAYLMSLDQSHALKEVKSTTPPSPSAPGKGPSQ